VPGDPAHEILLLGGDDLGHEAAIEKPSRSTWSKSRAWMNAMASLASSAIELGVLPCDAPTPRLSNVITRRCAAMPSTTRGSRLSRFAARWFRKITGVPARGPRSR
jgi:tagatose-1,6-bisphosphate aldolase non-catalytic subunit AgaZ/GatZ